MAAHIVNDISTRAEAVTPHTRAEAGSTRAIQTLQHKHAAQSETLAHKMLKSHMYTLDRVSGNVSATRRVKRAAKSLKSSQRERFMRRVNRRVEKFYKPIAPYHRAFMRADVMDYEANGDVDINMGAVTSPLQRRAAQGVKNRLFKSNKKNAQYKALKRKQYVQGAGKQQGIKATLTNVKNAFFNVNPLRMVRQSLVALFAPIGIVFLPVVLILFLMFSMGMAAGSEKGNNEETSGTTVTLENIPESVLKDLEGATDAQKNIIAAAYATGTRGPGQCAGYITDVFRNAGYGFIGGNANDMYWAYCTSSDIKDLKPGMIVAVPKSPWGLAQIYGHIGLYIGNGKIRENGTGPITETTLDQWIRTNGSMATTRWGWFGGIKLA